MPNPPPSIDDRLRRVVEQLALLAAVDGRACVELSEVSSAAREHDLCERDADLVPDLLWRRGIQVRDDCGHDLPDATRYVNRQLASQTTDALALFLRELPRHPLLTWDHEVDLAERAEQGDRSAAEQLVNSNLRSVVAYAREYQGQGLSLLDLIQAGILGCKRAVDAFDHRRGFTLSTYSAFWIRQAMRTAIQNGGRMIQVPIDPDEGGPRLSQIVISLSDRADETRPVAEARSRLTRRDSKAHNLAITLRGECLDQALTQLPQAQAQLIRVRYGLSGDAPLPIGQAAEMLGLPGPGVLRLEKEALSALARSREREALTSSPG